MEGHVKRHADELGVVLELVMESGIEEGKILQIANALARVHRLVQQNPGIVATRPWFAYAESLMHTRVTLLQYCMVLAVAMGAVSCLFGDSFNSAAGSFLGRVVHDMILVVPLAGVVLTELLHLLQAVVHVVVTALALPLVVFYREAARYSTSAFSSTFIEELNFTGILATGLTGTAS